MVADIARRGVLQGGALAGGLVALGGLRARPAAAIQPDRVRTLTGSIAGHIRLKLARGATIRLTELDQLARPVRDLVVTEMPLAMIYPDGIPRPGGGPLRVVCEQAQSLAVRVAADAWKVTPSECDVLGGRIVHGASGRTIAYRAWVDVT